MTIREIRQRTGLSQRKFADQYELPVRTLQEWEQGRRQAPDYVVKLLERAVKEDYGMERRKLEEMPFDKAFEVDGNEELCHATGYEVLRYGTWWCEYIDSEGDLRYGN